MINLYLSPRGNDRWSGTRATPNAKRSDGPLASLAEAQKRIRSLNGRRGLTEPVTVHLRGGVYRLEKPLIFDARDAGKPARRKRDNNNPWATDPACPITFKAYRNEQPILSGGRAIDGWQLETVNQQTVWVATVPDIQSGKWSFRQLWVNGKRAERPVAPRQGFYRIEKALGKPKTPHPWAGGHAAFRCAPGDVAAWTNLTDVEIAVYNYWIDSRMRIQAFNPKTRRVDLDRHCQTHLNDEWGKQGAQYRVEGALEHLQQPGEWCLDSSRGKVYYLPRPGERLASSRFIAADREALLQIEGRDPDTRPVELLTFEGLTFAHSEWQPPADYAASNQAAWRVPGAVRLTNSRDITFRRCTFAHLGGYGVECDHGCFGITIDHCRIHDLAGGGIKIWHGNSRITIRDNEIAHGGRIYGQAIGVLVGQSSGVLIQHNHIHDFHYSGISLGWLWGYRQGNAYGNVVEYNHVHDLGHGLLSDMGGIYTLGPQPGTRIRFNYFHHIDSRTYGGWAIYTDEGSSDILIENNLATHTKCGGFHQHYGRDNIIRNNIFVWSRETQLTRTRLEPHSSFTFERNIIVIDQGDLWRGDWSAGHAQVNHNLYWDHRFGKRRPAGDRIVMTGHDEKAVSLSAWQAMGLDTDSLIADPGFRNAARGDFRLKQTSAAHRIGFIPFDLSTIGPRS